MDRADSLLVMAHVVTRISWSLLMLVHLAPAAVVVRPSLLRVLYGVEPGGELAMLLVHRGALFVAIAVSCAYALVEPSARRAAAIMVGISMLSFLALYAQARFPPGNMRTLAIADAIALPPLVCVVWSAWRP